MATVDFFEDMNTASIMDFCSYTFADNRSSSPVLLSTLLSKKNGNQDAQNQVFIVFDPGHFVLMASRPLWIC